MIDRDTASMLAGQSMLLRFQGPVFTDEARDTFRVIRPAGVIFFGDNLASRQQVRDLTSGLQDEARSLGMPPLLIGIDQEGGIVSRFAADMVTAPGAMAMTAADDRELTQRTAEIIGLQLREMGINTDFAPVADVNNNPANRVIRTRSFGDTVERVETGALAMIAGLTSSGVMPTVKHFPGHGDTNVDSHLGLPVIPHSLERLHDIELRPFRTAIVAGVPAVMTTHIVFPVLDEHPATLSRAILTDLLRGELGFDGLIFTDSLSMDAIDKRYGLADTAIRCKRAGVDILEANESLDHQRTRHAALVDALLAGDLDEALFRATIQRLAVVRGQFAMGAPLPPLRPSNDALREEVEAIAARTIASIGPSALRPIAADDQAVIIDFQRLRSSEAEDPFNRGGTLRDAVARVIPATRVVTLGHQPTATERKTAIDLCAHARAIVVLTRDAVDFPYQVAFARACFTAAHAGTQTVHVALRGPWDAGVLGEVDTTLLTFGDPTPTLIAIVGTLAGRTPITAILPVTLVPDTHV